jgi:uncharacterized protein YjdB
MRFASSLAAMCLCVAGCFGAADKPTGSNVAPIASVSVTAGSSSILVGSTTAFTVVALTPSGGTVYGRAASWSSSSAAIATVTQGGVVTGVAPGEALIRATIDGVVGSAPITVVSATVGSVEIAGTPGLALVAGESFHLTAIAKTGNGLVIPGKQASWSTSNGAVASVSNDGTLLAVAPGAATITASIDGKSASSAVTVEARVLSAIAITPTPMLAMIGATAPIMASATDQRGAPITAQQFVFQSSNSAIASVSSTGAVTGVSAGNASISASALNVVGATTVTVLPPTTLSGSIAAADAGPLSNLSLALQMGLGASLQSFSTNIDATGAFRLDAPISSNAGDSVTLIVEDNARPRAYHPVFKRVRATVAPTVTTRPLLIATTPSFTSPTYGVSSVPISLQLAFSRVCYDDTNANCNSFFPQIWIAGSVPLWSAPDFPIPLAFNRDASSPSPITASDSIALWNVIHQMEDDLGRTLFRPVDFSSLTPPDANGFSPKAVLVSVDNTLSGFSAYTNWIWDGNQNMIAAKTRVRANSFLASRSLMSHELLHALGLHHTCGWTTVMGGYGCPSADGITRTDAAAFTLGYQTRAAIVARSPTTTFGDALRGEQMLEVTPVATLIPAITGVPFAPSGRRALVFGKLQVYGDGAP